MFSAGVYYIECVPAGSFYIGSSITSVRRRFNQHRHSLRRGKAENSKLQRAWDKYGESAFIFAPLIFCAPDEAREIEQQAIDLLHPQLNILKSVGSSDFRPAPNENSKDQAALRAKAAWAQGRFSRNGKTERNFYEVRGEKLSVAGIVAKYGLLKVTVQGRVNRGIRGDALALPPDRGRRENASRRPSHAPAREHIKR